MEGEKTPRMIAASSRSFAPLRMTISLRVLIGWAHLPPGSRQVVRHGQRQQNGKKEKAGDHHDRSQLLARALHMRLAACPEPPEKFAGLTTENPGLKAHNARVHTERRPR